MKTWQKIVRLLILVVILLPIATFIAVQIPAVQTFVVEKVASKLAKNIDGSVHVGKVYFSYPNNLILKDVDLIQGADDTVAHLGKLLVKVKASSLIGNEARIRRVSLENGYVRLRKYEDSTTNLSRLLAPMKNKPPKEPKSPEEKGGLPWSSISLDRLTVKHMDFSADTTLALQDINLSARNLHYSEEGASGRIDNLTLRKGDELAVQNLSMDLQYSPTGSSSLRNVCYDDDYTHLRAEYLAIDYDDMSDFSQFMEKVNIRASFNDTRFDLRTIKLFTKLKDMNIAGTIDGKINGTISNLQSDHLRVMTGTGETALDLKVRVKGLPDIHNAQFHVEVFQGETNTADLDHFIAQISPSYKRSTLSRYAPGEKIHLKVKADGPLSNLQSHAAVQVSSLGTADVDALVQINLKNKNIDISGNAVTDGLELGRILGVSSLGALDCRTDVAFARRGKELDIDIQPLAIDHIRFNGYDYAGLVATGTLRNNALRADIMSNDTNVVVAGHADINLGGKKKESHYVVDLDVDHVDLHAINLDKRDGAAVTFQLDADIVQTPEGSFLGQAHIGDLRASLPGESFNIGDLALDSRQKDDRYTITLDSDLFRAMYDGNIFITNFADKSVHLLYQDNLEHLFGGQHHKSEDLSNPEDFGSFNLQVRNLKPLTDFFLPTLFVAPYSTYSPGRNG